MVVHNTVVSWVGAGVFSSMGDFHLTASASDALDRGIAVAEAGRDLDGEPHTQGVPDIGADEYASYSFSAAASKKAPMPLASFFTTWVLV